MIVGMSWKAGHSFNAYHGLAGLHRPAELIIMWHRSRGDTDVFDGRDRFNTKGVACQKCSNGN